MVAEAPSETQLLQFECDNCHAQLCVPESFAGVSGPCPHCSHTITAPQKTELAVSEKALETAAACTLKSIEATDPLPKVETVVVAQDDDLAEAEPDASRSISIFERRGFRPIRMILATAATLVIFCSFQALKTRRWVWQHPAEETIAEKAAPAQNQPPAEAPAAPVMEGIKPPSLPNLQALSADSR